MTLTRLQRDALEAALGAARSDLNRAMYARSTDAQAAILLRGLLVLAINVTEILLADDPHVPRNILGH